MTKPLLQRLGIILTLLFALACCASAPKASEPQSTTAQQHQQSPELRLVFCADSKGNHLPCPT